MINIITRKYPADNIADFKTQLVSVSFLLKTNKLVTAETEKRMSKVLVRIVRLAKVFQYSNVILRSSGMFLNCRAQNTYNSFKLSNVFCLTFTTLKILPNSNNIISLHPKKRITGLFS
jgi:hypothetical protein